MPETPQFFISYKSEYRDFAIKIRDQIRSWGYEVWIDIEHIPLGEYFRHKIQEGLESSVAVIGLVTEGAFESREVQWEWDYGLKHSHLIPIKHPDISKLPYHIEGTQYIDFTDEKTGFEQLHDALKNPETLTDPIRKSEATKTPASDDPNREAMLQKVRNSWVKGVLEKSLHEDAAIELELALKPDAVLRHADYGDYTLPKSASILSIFKDMQRQLLILGDPGSGKTFMMLQLARDLIAEAMEDSTKAIPVVFNLSSWAVKHEALENWLIDELRTKYLVPKKVAEEWVKDARLLLLLDGLDEVAEEYRDDCVRAINAFHKTYTVVDTVVCSRIKDYEKLHNRLNLSSAIVLQGLTEAQINEYLQGDELATLRDTIAKEPILGEMARTPFLLNTMRYAYGDMPRIPHFDTENDWRDHLLQTYSDKRLNANKHNTYKYGDSKRYLRWLATQMVRRKKTLFEIEGLQPDWLESQSQLNKYRWRLIVLSAVFFGLVFALFLAAVIGSISYLMFEEFTGMIAGIIVGIIWGAVSGAILGGLTSLTSRKEEIRLYEGLAFSWKSYGKSLLINIMSGLVAGTGVGILITPIDIKGGLLIGIIAGMLLGMDDLLSARKLSTKTFPNQGIHHSLISALKASIFFSIVVGGITGIISSLFVRGGNEFINGGSIGAIVGILLGVDLGFWTKGGEAVIQHLLLRRMLEREGAIPRNYAEFLGYAVDCVLMRQVGGGFMFVHRMLLEHFAEEAD